MSVSFASFKFKQQLKWSFCFDCKRKVKAVHSINLKKRGKKQNQKKSWKILSSQNKSNVNSMGKCRGWSMT